LLLWYQALAAGALGERPLSLAARPRWVTMPQVVYREG
jgi:hypothetical protein